MSEPKIKYNFPKMGELLSKFGYRDDSPFKSRPFIDIDTPTGEIDMSNTGIPILANNKVLPPYSGIHNMGTTKVREVPLKNTFRWSPGQNRNFNSFLFHEQNEGNLIGGMGYNFPSGTQLNAAGVLPMSNVPFSDNPNPIFKGAIDMGIKQNFGNTDIGLNFSSPILNDPHEYFVNQNVQKQPLQFRPKISLTHRFRNGGSLPKAQQGVGNTLLNIINPFTSPFSPISGGIELVKNKIADNVNPYGYGNTFDRVYDAVFTTQDKEHNYYGEIGEDQSGERRDLLHMMLGLNQEGNTIPQQTQYVPTKGHNEGDIYYSSPFTENEIQEEIKKIGKTRKEVFYSSYDDEEAADKAWDENIEDDMDSELYWRVLDDRMEDDDWDMYDGKNITRLKSDVEDDPSIYIYYKDIPEYKKFTESAEYEGWEKKTKNRIAEDYEELVYSDLGAFVTKPEEDEYGRTSLAGGFYGGVLGQFTLNQGEDEKGKYISYYDKWDLDPFEYDDSKGDWKKKLTDFGQKHILNVDPTSIYIRSTTSIII